MHILRRLLRTLWLLILLSLGSAVVAESVESFVGFDDARENALGGAHAALVDDFSSMLTNPASLAAALPSFSGGRLDFRFAGPIFDIADLVITNISDPSKILSGVSGLIASNGNKFYAAADLSGPISLGYRGDGLGFGIFQRTHLGADVASTTSVSIVASEEVLIAGGYGLRIDLGHRNALDFGILAKGFVRGAIRLDGGLLDFQSLMSSTDILSTLLAEPFYLTTGVGIDAGMRWNWAEIISFGVACRDAYSPAQSTKYGNIQDFLNASTGTTTTGLIDPDLSAGFAFKPPLGIFDRVFDGLVIAVDYDDILDLLSTVPRNPILNVDAGIEIKLLDVLTFRIGVREALLQAGFGLDLDFVHIAVSAWGDELGIEPGQRSVYNLLLGIDFVY